MVGHAVSSDSIHTKWNNVRHVQRMTKCALWRAAPLTLIAITPAHQSALRPPGWPIVFESSAVPVAAITAREFGREPREAAFITAKAFGRLAGSNRPMLTACLATIGQGPSLTGFRAMRAIPPGWRNTEWFTASRAWLVQPRHLGTAPLAAKSLAATRRMKGRTAPFADDIRKTFAFNGTVDSPLKIAWVNIESRPTCGATFRQRHNANLSRKNGDQANVCSWSFAYENRTIESEVEA